MAAATIQILKDSLSRMFCFVLFLLLLLGSCFEVFASFLLEKRRGRKKVFTVILLNFILDLAHYFPL